MPRLSADRVVSRLATRRAALLAACLTLAAPVAAGATYSIAACERATGQCGVAVQTDNLAVGASVPSAQAGVGAVVSQFETHPRHGPRALALLAQGVAPAEVLAILLREDGRFEGRGPAARQVAVVAIDGRPALHTGSEAARAEWAGGRTGPDYSVQGNGLAGAHVVTAMERAFLASTGALADRLLAALQAGDAAGGQRSGRQSAALVVRTREGFPLDVDLRVDHDADPVAALTRLHDRHAARQAIADARAAGRRGQDADALRRLQAGVARAHEWPRALLFAAEVAAELEAAGLAVSYLERAFALDPSRIRRAIGNGTFAILGGTAPFSTWVDTGMRAATRAASTDLERRGAASPGERAAMAARLLETGDAARALALLPEAGGPDDFAVLRATALTKLGRRPAAAAACREALARAPGDVRLKRKLAALDRRR
jgi:uncharacterized Ntn-hydrolase superfamily protein